MILVELKLFLQQHGKKFTFSILVCKASQFRNYLAIKRTYEKDFTKIFIKTFPEDKDNRRSYCKIY